jgi:MoaA/NifB/PqqE/SkfB family radical SAM enzyme
MTEEIKEQAVAPKEEVAVPEESAEDVINNMERKRIQDNMREGNLSDCNDQCPQLNSLLTDGKMYWDIVPIEQLDQRIEAATIQIGFSYDPSCNLQCPSCRNKLIVWDPYDLTSIEGQRIAKIHANVKDLIKILLDQGKRVSLNITGSGDAFASILYWDYLVEMASAPIPKNLTIDIKTNGVMMTKDNWEKIKPLWPIINYVEVSIDAAFEETYKIVRKNGNFKKLKRNLDDFDQMVADKCFPNMHHWQTNFIVQRDNYRELKELVEWQLQFQSNPLVVTNLLAQWHHMSNDQFNSMAIWQETHPNRSELINILRDPIFQNPQLKLGNMSAMVPK